MGRRIYIIPYKAKVDSKVIKAAKLANCPEIVQGVPSALLNVIKEADLPLTYEETSPPAVEPVNMMAMNLCICDP